MAVAEAIGRRHPQEVQWDWVETIGVIGRCLTEASGLADLIIVNRKLDGFPLPDMAAVAVEAILDSGELVLAVPEDCCGLNLAGEVLVAWDGSDCSTAALQAAVPLMKLASTVTIVEVEDGSIKTAAREAATYLSHHGIKAIVRRMNPKGAKAGPVILGELRRARADYLVMGGFGHSRFVEALLGGVTWTMLNEAPVPVLLAH